jgi:hypothetical protein
LRRNDPKVGNASRRCNVLGPSCAPVVSANARDVMRRNALRLLRPTSLSVIAGLDPAIHHFGEEDGPAGQARG